MEPRFVKLDEVRPYLLSEGVRGRPLIGERTMLNLVELEPGAPVRRHSHPHEQLGVVLSGVLVMTSSGDSHECGPMQAFFLPGGVEHEAVAGPDGAVVLDVFTPIREDYAERWASGADNEGHERSS